MEEEYFLEVSGDLLDAPDAYIAHQCNCVSTHAGGIASAIFEKYPYANTYKEREDLQPWQVVETAIAMFGTIDVLGDGDNQRRVINMYSQLGPGGVVEKSTSDTAGRRIDAFEKCLYAIAKMVKGTTNVVAFPDHIGCGIAGGHWDTYRSLIKHVAEKEQVYFTIYKRENDEKAHVVAAEYIDLCDSTSEDSDDDDEEEGEKEYDEDEYEEDGYENFPSEEWIGQMRTALLAYRGIEENHAYLMHVEGVFEIEYNNCHLDVFVLKVIDSKGGYFADLFMKDFLELEDVDVELRVLDCVGLHEQQLISAVHYFHEQHRDHASDDLDGEDGYEPRCDRIFLLKPTDNDSLVARVAGLLEKLTAFETRFKKNRQKIKKQKLY
jgi:O-acetyl-ADP-ribose deacetylase (regulator of RNase III)